MTYGDGKPFDQLPEGFYKVSVVLNEAELRRLRSRVWRMPHGTYSEAIREAMGRPTSPVGLAKALREMRKRERDARDQTENTQSEEGS